MGISEKRNNRKWKYYIIASLVALVIAIATTIAINMTIACAHNPISHLRTRPDRDVLPSNVVPIKYDLTITPNMDTFTFDGHVLIEYNSRSSLKLLPTF